jgi:hypothetical protein
VPGHCGRLDVTHIKAFAARSLHARPQHLCRAGWASVQPRRHTPHLHGRGRQGRSRGRAVARPDSCRSSRRHRTTSSPQQRLSNHPRRAGRSPHQRCFRRRTGDHAVGVGREGGTWFPAAALRMGSSSEVVRGFPAVALRMGSSSEVVRGCGRARGTAMGVPPHLLSRLVDALVLYPQRTIAKALGIWLGQSSERRPAADRTRVMAGLWDSYGIEFIQETATLTDESVKWTGKNVLPSRPQAVLLV